MTNNSPNERAGGFSSLWVEKLQTILSDGLYKNSIWLVGNSFMMSGFGFLFWIINARLFSSDQIGIASALIASVQLLMTLSFLGFDIALIRYIPISTQKQKIINSCFSISGLFALVVSAIFVLFIKFFLPKLALIWDPLRGSIFVICVIFSLFFMLQASVLIAQKKSKYVFYKSLIFSVLKLILPFALLFLGAFGIFSSWLIGIIASVIAGAIFIQTIPKFEIAISVIKKMFSFSSVNYICTFLSLTPESLLPLLITNRLNTSATAYFYISWNIAMILFFIPISISKTLLAEDRSLLKKNIVKSVKFISVLLIPAMFITIAISKYILLLFGAEYSENANLLLNLLAVSSIPFAINTLYIAIYNVKHNLRAVLTLHFALASGTLGLSYLFMIRGLIYVGISWLISNAITALVLIVKTMVTKSG
ncbi:MAG: oligosaccharide flippase family protein [Promethearchaeota archaeon]|jgi:O-antigen/teichoic acid export membrane protein